MNLLDILQQNPTFLYPLTLLLGLAVGSFLNVVVFRLPTIMENDWRRECAEYLHTAPATPATAPLSLSHPPSHCPHCGHRIHAWENIPVLSYLLLRGKCSACHESISPRYPLTEALTALLSVIVIWRFGPGAPGLAALALTWALIALSLIDYDVKLLPDDLTLPLLWAGLLLSLGGLFADPRSAIVGAVAGYLSLWMVYQSFRLLTGKEGMGYGDFKLLALLGAWLGWQYLLQIVLLSSLVGAVSGVLLIVVRGRDRQLPIPFGPYLAAAGWISLLWGPEINQLYFRWSGLS